mmetsp:Transcript_50158/g.144232  ORF Transcript_50158/g.144232 Transcript_50158/m.144232 type:complete len:375 (+) Transcript_50158:84-1208(+)
MMRHRTGLAARAGLLTSAALVLAVLRSGGSWLHIGFAVLNPAASSKAAAQPGEQEQRPRRRVTLKKVVAPKTYAKETFADDDDDGDDDAAEDDERAEELEDAKRPPRAASLREERRLPRENYEDEDADDDEGVYQQGGGSMDDDEDDGEGDYQDALANSRDARGEEEFREYRPIGSAFRPYKVKNSERLISLVGNVSIIMEESGEFYATAFGPSAIYNVVVAAMHAADSLTKDVLDSAPYLGKTLVFEGKRLTAYGIDPETRQRRDSIGWSLHFELQNRDVPERNDQSYWIHVVGGTPRKSVAARTRDKIETSTRMATLLAKGPGAVKQGVAGAITAESIDGRAELPIAIVPQWYTTDKVPGARDGILFRCMAW